MRWGECVDGSKLRWLKWLHVVWRHLEPRLPRALPRLGGWRFKAFRILWGISLLTALAGLLGGNYYVYQRSVVPAKSFAVFGLAYALDVPMRLLTPLSVEAAKAGISSGDAVIEVGGISVTDDDHPPKIAAILDASGDAVTVRVRSQTGQIIDAHLTRSAGHAAEMFAGSGLTVQGRLLAVRIIDTLVGLVLLVAATLLYLRRPRDSVAALLSFAFLLLLTSYGWTYFAENNGNWFVRTVRPTAWLMMNAILFTFPSGRFEPRWTGLAVLGLPVIWVIWALQLSWPLVIMLNTVMLLLAIWSMRLRYRGIIVALERQQIKWAMFGFVIGAAMMVIAIFNQLGMPLLTSAHSARAWADLLAPIFLIFMVLWFGLGLLISLLRYRLYDADSVISRSAAAAMVTLLIAAVFAGTERAIELSFHAVIGHNSGSASAGVAAAITAVMFAPLHERVSHWTARRFQKALVQLRHDLPLAVGDLRETMSPNALTVEVIDRIVKGVRASRAAILLEAAGALEVIATIDTSETEIGAWRAESGHDIAATKLVCDRDDARFPLRIPLCDVDHETHVPFGWILLGPRPDGSFYGRDEQEALEEIADPVARGLLVARQRHAQDSAAASAVAALNSRISGIEATLAQIVKSLGLAPEADQATRTAFN